MSIKFNVFGRTMSVERTDCQWILFHSSESGVRRKVHDVIIPPDLDENELGQYLDDIYHEYATENFPVVEKI